MNRLCGFNFQWLFSGKYGQAPEAPDLKALDFCAEHGFKFVRIPTSYWFWTKDFDYDNPDERIFEHLDLILKECQQRGLHMSLNIHRGPGYCINGNDLEKHNLWKDKVAQDAFTNTWINWSHRYKGVSAQDLSFDLLNEPPEPGQFEMTRGIHADLMTRVFNEIRAIDPLRPVTLDGLGGGHMAMPELAHLPVTHSGRGYMPMTLSHWGANWWTGWKDYPAPTWPGAQFAGITWDREKLHEFYQPWRDVESQGAAVHMGEFGCFNHVDNETALAWLTDLMGLWKSYGWGWGLWGFEGAFGFIEHGRPGAVYENYKGYQVDRAFLDLLMASIPE